MLAIKRAVIRCKGLELAINRSAEGIGQLAIRITRKQRVPVRAPEQLNHMPASAAEQGL